ncbi:MAG: MBL fold metallo-hydrolase [Pseudomonadota bacterium]
MANDHQNRSLNWQPNRRTVLTAAALSGAAGGSLLITGGASSTFASGPKSTITVGDVTVMSLSDGHLALPEAFAASNVPPDQRRAALQKAGQTGDMLRSPLNVTLITTKTQRILVDTGSGARFMASAGKLSSALGAANVAPDSITKVVFTHAHPDHCWGTLDDFDDLTFANAEHVISEAEWAFWMADDTVSKLPEDRKAFGVGAQRQLGAAKDQTKMVKPGDDIATGIRVVDSGGHTPGHISLEVGTGRERLMILGDALTHPVISFEHPDWTPAGDQDPARAVKTRQRLLSKLASEGQRIIGYHLPSPGFGRVVKRGTGYRFEADF